MEVIPLIFVPAALLAGLVSQRVVGRAPHVHRPRLRGRLTAAILPLICLLLWVVTCYGFKLLTWKPFAGDARGSVSVTNGLLLAGSALTGVWISARLRGGR